MFRHQGEARTLKHNLQLASLLSFVAGIVNVAGFLSVHQLTTNVTGHFAFFIDDIYSLNFLHGLVFFLYIIAFFLGSFFSGFIVEYYHKRNWNHAYAWPVIMESLLLFTVALWGQELIMNQPDTLACLLLFAMGLQNSLVTKISNALVRTTHLTGLFTDLGIEFSQLFFYKEKDQQQKLFSSIRLRLTIISFFFLGGITGGVFYSVLQLHVLFIAGAILLLGIAMDYLKLRWNTLRKKNSMQV